MLDLPAQSQTGAQAPALAEALLGTAAIRLYEAHNWAKYSGATDYDQLLHCDYGNHTPVVPADDLSMAEVEMFIYIHGVPEGLGPTHVVSQHHTRNLPMWPPRRPLSRRSTPMARRPRPQTCREEF